MKKKTDLIDRQEDSLSIYFFYRRYLKFIYNFLLHVDFLFDHCLRFKNNSLKIEFI